LSYNWIEKFQKQKMKLLNPFEPIARFIYIYGG
jgi:hypothetical protein